MVPSSLAKCFFEGVVRQLRAIQTSRSVQLRAVRFVDHLAEVGQFRPFEVAIQFE